jgi:hypothetical protein
MLAGCTTMEIQRGSNDDHAHGRRKPRQIRPDYEASSATSRVSAPTKTLEKGAAVAKVEVSNHELHTIRDAMRTLNRIVEDLEQGVSEKYVLTKNGQMRAVVVSVDYFAALRDAVQPSNPIGATP